MFDKNAIMKLIEYQEKNVEYFNTKPNSEVKKDLELIRYILINSITDDYHNGLYASKPYLITTQNLRYIKDLTENIDLKNCITILGGGDPVFELLASGANHVTAIDVNKLQNYVFHLKKASIKAMSAKDYTSFLFNGDKNRYLNRDVYKTVRTAFNEEEKNARDFWDNVFDEFHSWQISDNICKGGIDRVISKPSFYLPYLNGKYFYNVREALEKNKVTLQTGDIYGFLKTINPKDYNFVDITNTLLFKTQLSDNLGSLDIIFQDLKDFIDQMEEGLFIFDYMFGITDKELKTLKTEFQIEQIDLNNPEKAINQIYAINYQQLQKLKSNLDIIEKTLTGGSNATPNKGVNDTLFYTLK